MKNKKKPNTAAVFPSLYYSIVYLIARAINKINVDNIYVYKTVWFFAGARTSQCGDVSVVRIRAANYFVRARHLLLMRAVFLSLYHVVINAAINQNQIKIPRYETKAHESYTRNLSMNINNTINYIFREVKESEDYAAVNSDKYTRLQSYIPRCLQTHVRANYFATQTLCFCFVFVSESPSFEHVWHSHVSRVKQNTRDAINHHHHHHAMSIIIENSA